MQPVSAELEMWQLDLELLLSQPSKEAGLDKDDNPRAVSTELK